MKISPRFALDNLFVVGGAFLTVSAMSFAPGILKWLGFGVSAGIAVVAGGAVLLIQPRRERIGHAVVGLVALWSLIAALVFTGTTMTWLVFADGIALAVVALADLTGHEMNDERVVHELTVTQQPAESSMLNGKVAA